MSVNSCFIWSVSVLFREEGDNVDIEEMEDKVDDRDIKKLDEAVEGIKLQDDNGDNALQGLENDDNDNQDEVGLTVCLKLKNNFWFHLEIRINQSSF